jgi:hypothetical protein
MVNFTPQNLYVCETNPVTIEREAIWTTEAFVKILEKQKSLVSAGFEHCIVQPMHIISNIIVGR